MDVIIDCCAGLDVHKASLTACVRMPGEGLSRRRQEVRVFSTVDAELQELRAWLRACGVTDVVMEAAGVYWKPIVRHEALSDRGEVEGLPLWVVAAVH